VDERIAAADLTEQDSVCSIIQKLDVVPRNRAVLDQRESKDEMLDAGRTPAAQPADQPADQPAISPLTSPTSSPKTSPKNRA
jgi:hypothetical protein